VLQIQWHRPGNHVRIAVEFPALRRLDQIGIAMGMQRHPDPGLPRTGDVGFRQFIFLRGVVLVDPRPADYMQSANWRDHLHVSLPGFLEKTIQHLEVPRADKWRHQPLHLLEMQDIPEGRAVPLIASR